MKTKPHPSLGSNAVALAEWCLVRMANRTDACGGYYRKNNKTTPTTRKKITLSELLAQHFQASKTDHVIGLHSICPKTNTSKWLAFDIDKHTDGDDPLENWKAVQEIATRLESHRLTPHVFDSNGAGGYHVFVFFEEPQPTDRVHVFGNQIIESLPIAVEVFPKQSSIAPTAYGNWIRVPGRHHTRDHWTKVWTGEHWNAFTADYLLSIEGDEITLPDAATPIRPDHPDDDDYRAPGIEVAKVIDRLKRIPPAVQGHKGHDATYRVCCMAVRDHGLSTDQAYVAIEDWNQRCDPPWSRGELLDLIENAKKYGRNPRGVEAAEENFGNWFNNGDTTVKVADVAERFVEMDPEWFPPVWRDFCDSVSRAVGTSFSLVAAFTIPIITAAIGATRRCRLKNSWREPCAVWVAGVIESGGSKSPVLRHVVRPLDILESLARAEYEAAMQEYEESKLRHEVELRNWKKKGTGPVPILDQEPTPVRYFTDNATIEAIAKLLNENPRGMALVNDELSGLLCGFGRYGNGPGAATAEVSQYLKLYDGGALTVDRRGNGSIRVSNATMSMLGGIQPGVAKRAFRSEYREAGLLARFLVVSPPKSRSYWDADRDIDPAVEDAYTEMIAQLCTLSMGADRYGNAGPVDVPLSPSAMALWREIHDEQEDERFDASGDRAAAQAKLKGIAARLALAHHFVCWACAPEDEKHGYDEIGVASMQFAVNLTRWFRRETGRVYSIIDETPTDGRARDLLEIIHDNGGELTVRELMQKRRRDYPKSDTATQALETLVASGLATKEYVNTGGHPKLVFKANTQSQNTKTRLATA